jgi:phosphoribosylglycinamide formyltransferase-1
MSALARAGLAGTIGARVTLVIADRESAAGLASARDYGAETATVLAHSGAAAFEAELAGVIDQHQPDAIALAGFMRILSAPFVARYLGRMFNIHPSILPAYRGLHTHRRVLAAGEREHGASVHFVTAELDGGPLVLQSRVTVKAGDSEEALAARVLATEHVIYPQALGWFAQRRLTWHDEAPWLDGRRLDAPVVEDFRASAT